MKVQKRNTIHSIGTAIIIAFFMFLVFSLVDKSSTPNSLSQNALSSDFHADKDLIADAIPLQLVQKHCVPLLSKFFCDNNNAFSNNSKITRRFILLQKKQLSIKPLIPCRFYYHLFSNDAGDLPGLS